MENLMKKENKYKIPYILNSRCIGLKNYKHIALFLIGFLGLTVISLIVTPLCLTFQFGLPFLRLHQKLL